MSELQQKGELPLSMMGQVGGEGVAATIPRPLPPPRLASKTSADFSGLSADKPGMAKRKDPQAVPDLFTRELQVTHLAFSSANCQVNAPHSRRLRLRLISTPMEGKQMKGF